MIFISYSRKQDKWWIDKFLAHFRSINPEFADKYVWSDEKIQSGENWNTVIEEKRNSARIAVMFVTAEYLASDFIRKKELDYFLLKDNVIKYWFLVEDCPWQHTGLSHIQCANANSGSNLIPLASDKDSVNTIFAVKCIELYKIANCLKNMQQNKVSMPVKEYPEALIYHCNRNIESALIAEGYRELTKKNNVMCFASLTDENDNFSNLSETIKYKSLKCSIGNEGHVAQVDIDTIDLYEIAEKNLVVFICYMIKKLTGKNIQPEEALTYSVQDMYDGYAKNHGKTIVIYSISVKSNCFYEEKFAPIVNWINNHFSKNANCSLHVIFLFHLINGFSEKNNNMMKTAVLKKSIPITTTNYHTIYRKPGKAGTIFYLGEHSNVSRETFEHWYNEHIYDAAINRQVNDALKDIYHGYRDELYIFDNNVHTGYALAKVKMVQRKLKSFIGHINGIIAD